MAWDSRNNSLYAATECEYLDPYGRNNDYRVARTPRFSANASEAAPEFNGSAGVNEDEEEYDHGDRAYGHGHEDLPGP